MSNATPPGWYPDVNVPGTERWWDGTAWTVHTRAPAVPQPLSVPRPPAAPARRAGRTVALTAAALAVVAAAVTGWLTLGGDGGTSPETAPTAAPPPTASDSASAATPSPAGGPEEDPAVLTDQLNGVTLPVPDGWEKPESTLDDLTTMRTVDSYTCPGDSGSFCYHGTVTVRTAGGTDLTVMKTLAEQDIEKAADLAYGENLTGDLVHGGIRSHRTLASKPVTVAGRTGHLVRWRVTTGKGPGGYVQSLVFPSAVGSETPVIVRFAFDADQDALPLTLMDTLTEGIRPVGDATGGGVGSTVAP
ncbi:DUF2510 domain-containing protein [Streptomyces sp. NBC_00059]|uniref:DUF2510 domain-containing protein n=1 Tax=Streptomyces sp. NBC_00059 TaxID=2975635 RepID=UPI0022528DF6|nr:DUF2510 domain-containing protein [Streptomyces sp. NBC_00059]MCX5413744.1 DUF2510 domain-containing protein [Streptomyces sp. NBC_00059]